MTLFSLPPNFFLSQIHLVTIFIIYTRLCIIKYKEDPWIHPVACQNVQKFLMKLAPHLCRALLKCILEHFKVNLWALSFRCINSLSPAFSAFWEMFFFTC